MASESQFLRAVMPSLPTEISTKLRSLCAASPANESALENLIRLLAGGTAAPDASNKMKEQWAEKQAATKVLLATLLPLPTPSGSSSDSKKRSREDSADADADEHDLQQLKKPRLAPSPAPPPAFDPGAPLFTLHSISTTSPIRKKVDTTIHAHAVVMTHPTSKTIEAVVPTTFLRRAFILPTRGKTKPHWTVVLLSGDVPDAKGKSSSFSSSTGGGTSSGANGVSTSNSEIQQIIFGIDAITTSNSSFSTTTYSSSSSSSPTQPTHQTLTKGSPTLPSIHIFLSHLPPTLLTPPIEPSSQGVFKSACPGIMGASATLSTTSTSSAPQGIPGVEAYRGAKPGNLWFAEEGVLWGESKPCEFWAVGDLLGLEGLRVVGAGRTCSVILTRRVKVEVQVREGKEGKEGKEGGEEGEEERGGEQEGEAEGEEQEEEMGEETEFGMIDSKEREGIYEWTRNHRHLFFHPSSSSLSGQKPNGNRSINGKEKDKEKEIAPSKSTSTSSKPSTLTSTSASKSTSKAKAKPKLTPSKSAYQTYTGPQTIRTIHNLSEDEDEEDEDFGADVDVDDLDGSERSSEEEEEEEESSSSSDEGDEDEGEGEGEEGQEGQDEDEDAESDEDGAGAGGGTGGEADADVDLNADEDEDELDELDQLPLNPAHHPLLRPGAMPKRMSKAAVQMVVGIVEGAFLGGGGGGSDGGVNATADEEHEEEQDELEDELELKDELDE